jgi:hypothetical protein
MISLTRPQHSIVTGRAVGLLLRLKPRAQLPRERRGARLRGPLAARRGARACQVLQPAGCFPGLFAAAPLGTPRYVA